MKAKGEESSLSNVLVTGATGRLGRRLVEALVERGNTVKALVIGKEEVRNLPPGTIPIIGTLNDVHVLDEACSGVDVVFHLAAALGETKAKTGELMHVNVEGTAKLLEPCKRMKVKHLIFTSTLDVYGNRRKEELTEESEPKPTDKYGYSKMLAEREIMDSGVPYTIFRIAAIYGPGFESSFFKVFRAVKEGKVAIIGSGRNHLSLIHVNDVVKALMLVKENHGISLNKVYNLSDGEKFTQEDLIALAAEMLGVERPDRHVSELLIRMIARQRNLDSDELKFLSSDRIVDISKIEKELGFSRGVDIHEGGMEMIDDFLNKSKLK